MHHRSKLAGLDLDWVTPTELEIDGQIYYSAPTEILVFPVK